ncbi:protocatechuate 3,4-dioxygenase subunit alpha [Amnibacterium sp. CER49]|uniref:protocatechuate 3,4-dioxygenase subunit alpha n=1 Tax=Amnibacterium sp. CER49 TaxID=3039161 RepID=UPI00244B175E|nr:protocatechuate 3,4-dioxygenase subunit alpha [Amnibacterium sp. CER49]MDH2443187.1 protocatechuate 3,4-dioxygenase subunit alpha [Amnibacterium sp. CER49]
MSTEDTGHGGRPGFDTPAGAVAGQEHRTAAEALADEQPLEGLPNLAQTPSQTVGPFFGYALPFAGGAELVPAGRPDAVVLHGIVLDGAGDPVPDALLELWQPDAAGVLPHVAGSRRRSLGRFTGFGRTGTEADGEYAFTTLLPGAVGDGPRWALVTVFARGLSHHLFTRAYFVADGEPDPSDALLDRVGARSRTLLARQDGPGSYRFDVRLQGDGETVFLDYREAPAR